MSSASAALISAERPAELEAMAPGKMPLWDGPLVTEGRGVFTELRFGLLLAMLIMIAFPEIFSGGRAFFYRDFGLFGYPLAYYHKALFWRGELPLWNPFNNCGLPFLAQWNTLTLYPGSLIYLLLPLPWSLSFYSLAHLWLAGMGMFSLSRSWTRHSTAAAVAGVAYACNGLMLHAVMWPNNIAALAWMPWVILLMERAWLQGGKAVLIAAVIGAVQMLAGAPEIILLTWAIVGLLWLSDLARRTPSLGSAGAVGLRLLSSLSLVAALSAIQLLPFLELLRQSHRTTSFGGNEWAMPAWGWANFLVPLFHCSKSMLGVYGQDSQQWTSSYYIGVGALIFAVMGLGHQKRSRVLLLAALGLFGSTMALGGNGFLFPLVKTVAPQLGFVRYPIKFVVLTIFSVPLLAGFGVDYLFSRSSRGEAAAPLSDSLRLRAVSGAWVGSFWPLLVTGVVLAGFIGAITGWGYQHPVPGEHIEVTLCSGLSRAAFLTFIVVTLLLSQMTRGQRMSSLLQLAAVLLVALDPLTHAPRQNPTVPKSALSPGGVDLGFMPRLGEGRAMITPRVQTFLGYAATPDRVAYHLGHRRTLLGDLNLVEGVAKVNGFYSLYYDEQAQVEALLYQPDAPTRSGLLDFLGVVQISRDDGWFDWSARATASPLITGGARPVFADQGTALRGLADPGFPAKDRVYLPREAEKSIGATNRTTVQIDDSAFRTHEVAFRCRAPEPSMLVIAQSFAPGWRAWVDQEPVRVWRANVAFQAIEVPAGQHQVRFEYSDPAFHRGARISLAGLTICLVAGLMLGARKEQLCG